MTRRIALAAAGIAALAMTSFAGQAAADEAPAGAARIVSIGGSVTETIFALGEEDRIVAVDTTSIYPAAASDLPDVGYMRALSAEGVLATEPDLILALEGAGPPAAVQVLEQASVPMIEIAEGHSAQGVTAKIKAVAAALGKEEAGAELAKKVLAEFDQAGELTAGIEKKKRVLFVLGNSNGRLLVSGTGTAADAMIALAGAENVMSEFAGYRPASDEAVVAANPDAVLMMERGDHGMAVKDVLSQPALAGTAAAQNGALITMDGLYLLGFGPRTAQAVRDLTDKLYPERAARSGTHSRAQAGQ